MKKAVLLIAMIALLCSMVSAATCSIDAKAEIREGEEMYFSYTINAGIGSEVGYIPWIACNGNMPLGEAKEIWNKADARGQVKGGYSLHIVNSDIEPQECTAKVTISTGTSCEKKIKISTLPILKFILSSCAEPSCSKQKSSFVKGNTVYLKGNTAATASITAPDGSTQRVTLPGSFTASQSGEYAIDISATKSGFKPFASTSSIFVIEQAYTVPYADFSSKAGQAVIRPVFKAPSAIAATNKVPVTPTAKKSSIKSLLSRVTGYFTAVF